MLPNQRLKKKPHQKSRNGCINCKLRKVKVGHLVHPRIPILTTRHSSVTSLSPGVQIATDFAWIVVIGIFGKAYPYRHQQLFFKLTQSRTRRLSKTQALLSSDTELNIAQAELLHQFITCTGPNLGGSDDLNHPIVKFWSRNATLLAISYPYLLHLSLSLAAYHLAFLASETEPSKARYTVLARHHFSVGLTQANEALSAIDKSTCGSLYVSTILVCFCSFAAGPSGPDDLFVCSAGGKSSHKWLPLARGARLIRELYDESVLFSGLTEPFGSNSGIPPEDPRPTCVCRGFVRVDWTGPVARLHDLVMSTATSSNGVYVDSLQMLTAIYEVTFGDNDGSVKAPLHHKAVLIWIYLMDGSFVECLQRKDPIALLLLAYYAPLIKTLKRDWFLHGWAEHILRASEMFITDDYADFLQWPAAAVRSI
ncbi:uncharacterized protein FOBCDRAFT_277031 [Fusarium oxysporum Fo47]|uniref:C6 zinc finger domain-containing protein n=1 Tax=Fusarium oxysporum Fo47 TaxID=660027 RepID=W9JG04_FUSOX|nr:uncharacterized protein FOBCDRAFT_277031 [Fusarium oxysporum Fo47]EWZ29379.1 hypothetical protein FOZG_17007 [Fusarium oxysporum Fo47]QKD57398.2 hypothetical protein FOBCDRAFT_277031 [Fusarium oxysporum Fo47]